MERKIQKNKTKACENSALQKNALKDEITERTCKLNAKLFNFSDESDSENDQPNQICSQVNRVLREKNVFSVSNCITPSRKRIERIPSSQKSSIDKHANSSVVSNKSNSPEWESVLNNTRHQHSITFSGKKKLFTETGGSFFVSNPTETKSKRKNTDSLEYHSLLHRSKLREDGDENISFEKSASPTSLEMTSYTGDDCSDKYVEVKDVSAQTSFHLSKNTTPSPKQHPSAQQSSSTSNLNVSHCSDDCHPGKDSSNEECSDPQFTENDDKIHSRFVQNSEFTESSSCSINKHDLLHSHVSESESFIEVQDASMQTEHLDVEEMKQILPLSPLNREETLSGGIEPVSFDNEEVKVSHVNEELSESPVKVESEGHLSETLSMSSTDIEAIGSKLTEITPPLQSSLPSQGYEQISDSHNQEENPHNNAENISDSDTSAQEAGCRSLYVTAMEHFFRDVESNSFTNYRESERKVLAEETDSDCSADEEDYDQNESAKVEESGSESDEMHGSASVSYGIREEPLTSEASDVFIAETDKEQSYENKMTDSLGKDNEEEEESNFITENHRESMDEDKKISQISEKLMATKISRKYSDSSDDDDAFERFLTQMRAPAEVEKKQNVEAAATPMKNFIVDDGEILSDEDSASDSSDDEMLHVKVDNILDSKRRSSPRLKNLKLCESGTESSEDSTREKKAVPTFQFSTDDDDDEDLLDEISANAKPTITKIFSSTETALPSGAACNEESPQKLSNKQPIKPSTFSQPSHDDDRDANDFKTPFKTPRRPLPVSKLPLKPFESPMHTHRSHAVDITPSSLTAAQKCPSTISRFSRPSNIGLDDDSIFLKSLSEDYPEYKKHPEAVRYVKNFKETRERLTARLFQIYHKSVFKEQLPPELVIEWSALYRKTAGTFTYKGTSNTILEAKITLSIKVCDRPERVRDTLAHELCHAAVRLIDGVRESHGPVWRSWAQRVNRAFPFMPVIARCHDYVIATKYTYVCRRCNYRIGRHSKSLDTEKKVCGHCHGRFDVFLTKELNSSESDRSPATPRTPRTPNKFALFVKECYSEVKKKNNSLKHGDLMKILSQQFAEKNRISDS